MIKLTMLKIVLSKLEKIPEAIENRQIKRRIQEIVLEESSIIGKKEAHLKTRERILKDIDNEEDKKFWHNTQYSIDMWDAQLKELECARSKLEELLRLRREK